MWNPIKHFKERLSGCETVLDFYIDELDNLTDTVEEISNKVRLQQETLLLQVEFNKGVVEALEPKKKKSKSKKK